jgi:glycerophosphoryl diester phosphodiesterase
MTTKDSFDAFVNIVRDKIDEFSENIDPPKIEIIQNELKEKFNNLAESQGYVSSEEYEALKILAKRLEERVSKLEDLLSKSEGN